MSMSESTGSNDSSIRVYMREIVKTDLLTPQEEIDLATRIKDGDEEAREKMIKANLRLVVKIAQDYSSYGLPLQDLISEGNIGLMKAVERFDPKKGGKVSTYAAWWIKQGVKRALANQSKTIRLPVHMVDKIAKLRRIQTVLEEILGRDPTDEELHEETGIPLKKISLLKQAAQRPMSLDAPVGDGDSNDLADVVPDPDALAPDVLAASGETSEDVLAALICLNERERRIVDARFGLAGKSPMILEAVGREFGVTRERIRQLEGIALGKMRKAIAKKETVNAKTEKDEASIWESEEKNSGMKKREREGTLEFSGSAPVTWAHLKSLPKKTRNILAVWYSPYAYDQDPATITKWVNSTLKTPLTDREVMELREAGILRLIKLVYGIVVKKNEQLLQRKVMEGLMDLLK